MKHALMLAVTILLSVMAMAQRSPLDYVNALSTLESTPALIVRDSINSVSNNITALQRPDAVVSNVPSSFTLDNSRIVGEIPYSCETTNDGMVNVNVPINPMAMEWETNPSISIKYHGKNSFDNLGRGWTISGLSVIKRTGSNFFTDSISRGVRNDTLDNYELDGVRLILQDIEGTSRYYKTQVGDIKVIFKTTDNQFVVLRPDGSKSIYSTQGLSRNFVYVIKSRAFIDGNIITYGYNIIGARHQIYSINYGENRQMLFEYEMANDYATMYKAGYEELFQNKLKSIAIKQGSALLYTYSFTYSTASIKSPLERIDLASTDDGTLHPLSFYYYKPENATDGFNQSAGTLSNYYNFTNPNNINCAKGKFEYSSENDGLILYPNKISCYIDGDQYKSLYDGTEHVIAATTVDQFGVTGSQAITIGIGFVDAFALNVDNYGDDELIVLNNYINNNNDCLDIHVYTNVFGQFTHKFTRTFNWLAITKSGKKSVRHKTFLAGDFDGDGKQELLIAFESSPLGLSGYNADVCLIDIDDDIIKTSGTMSQYIVNHPTISSTEEQLLSLAATSDHLFAYDYDGDGKMEIALVTSAETQYYEFNKNANNTVSMSLAATNNSFNLTSIEGYNLHMGNFNGDALADILLTPFSYNGVERNPKILTGIGNGSFNTTNFSSTMKLNGVLPVCRVQDIDKDGQSDIIQYYHYNSSTSNKLYWVRCNHSVPETQRYISQSTLPIILLIADIYSRNNGAAISSIANNGSIKSFSYKATQEQTHLMSGMVDSYGNIRNFSYTMLFPSANYEPNFSYTFPYQTFIGRYNVCTSMRCHTNSILIEDMTFSYGTAVFHMQGFGFCGFDTIDKADNLNNETYHYTFSPTNYAIPIVANTPQQTNTYTFTINVTSDKRIEVRMTKDVLFDKATQATKTKTYTYDSYGNITNIANKLDPLCTEYEAFQYAHVNNDNYYLPGLITKHAKSRMRTGTSMTYFDQRFSYNGNYRLSYSRQYSNNLLTKYEFFGYNNNGSITTHRTKHFTSNQYLTETFSYGGTSGKVPTSKTDVRGNTSTYAYGSYGLTQLNDERGNVTSYVYDKFGRKRKTILPTGVIITDTLFWANSNFGEPSHCKRHIEPGKPMVDFYYNQLDQEIQQVYTGKLDEDVYIFKEYDNKGRLVGESLPCNDLNDVWNRYTYDSFNRVVDKTFADGRVETYSYQGLSITSTIEGITTTKTYDAFGFLKNISNPSGTISYVYRMDGQPTSIKINNNITTSFTYDSYGRRSSISDPSAGTRTFSYDANGNISIETDACGRTTTSTYNIYGDLISRNYNNLLSAAYNYNSYGQLTSLYTPNNGKYKIYSYDGFGRLVCSNVNGFVKKFHYINNSNISEIEYHLNNDSITSIVYNYYNPECTLFDIRLKNNENPQYGSIIYAYDGVNRHDMVTNYFLGANEVNITCDDANRVIEKEVYGRFTGQLSSMNYTYNSTTCNMTSRYDSHNSSVVENFTYDSMNRLLNDGQIAVAYDNIGTITSKSLVGSLTTSANRPYQIEEQSNLGELAQTHPLTITYNAMLLPDTISNGITTSILTYFGDGSRASMSSESINHSEIINYYDQSLNTIEVCDYNTISTTKILYLGGSPYDAQAALVNQNNGGWNLFYIIRDNVGSIIYILDADGNVVQHTNYDAWGRQRDTSTLEYIDDEPLFLYRGFGSHEYLSDFGIYNMNARLYDPTLGIFLSPDPQIQTPENTQNYNRYSYCLNNPLKYRDENGEFFIGLIFGFFKGLFTGQNPFKTAWKTAVNEFKIEIGLFKVDWSNGFWSGLGDLVSRFTFELPQTALGLVYSIGKNALSDVDKIEYYYGATYVIDLDASKRDGITLGNFININTSSYGKSQNNRDVYMNGFFDPTMDQLFMHEYGHYLQSKSYGPLYLIAFGVPSIFSSIINKNEHTHFYIEKDASTRAAAFFGAKYGVIWDNKEDPTYEDMLNYYLRLYKSK
ncbi:MAG: hypothetical protein IJU62_02300 [Muribaculaceae bacterium]|nr:hypothetical protein [Muribaculaceae bacterium]